MTETPEHLHATRTGRGFDHMPPIPGAYGGQIEVYESSAASGPHLWLKATDRDGNEVVTHLSAESAWAHAEQVRHLLEHHYQGDARPEGER